MKTKVLLLTVALSAIGAATSMAQVYSQNAVGYINVTVPANKLQMIANQLNNDNNQLQTVIPAAPEGTIVYQFLPNGTYNVSTFIASGVNIWDPDPTIPMDPGLGVFISNPTASPMTITFVGEVPQGTLNTAIPTGLSIRSSKVPQAGGVTTALGYPGADGDICYQYLPASGTYNVNTFIGAGINIWDPNEPNIAVGESFFISTGAAKTWSRTFTVN